MKIAVVKLSGKTIDQFVTGSIGKDLINNLKLEYEGVVIIHGGGKLISEWSTKLGHEVSFYEGQRVTCKNTIDVVSSVQGGLLNSKITSYLYSFNIRAIGLNGIDGGAFIANQLDDKLGYVGRPVVKNQLTWIVELLKQGFVPVFSSLCSDQYGQIMNVNADLFAAALSISLSAEAVLFFSDVDGVLLNNKYQNLLTMDDIKEGISSGEINGGMIPKMHSCLELIDQGVSKIWIGNNFNEFTNISSNKKRGTWIVSTKRIAI
jgi:acetylglutamate kinase